MDYLCNLLIPGAAKSGTTSLCAALDQHPDICVSTPKEPQFFTADERFAGGAAAHNALFRGAKARYYADGSQSYFPRLQDIERIAEALGRPKVIIVLRDPIARAISHYAWRYRRATETDSLEEAFTSRGWNVEYVYEKMIQGYQGIGGYLAHSNYSRWVPEWRSRFGEENVLLLRYEDFAGHEAAVLRRCFDFLGLPTPEGLTIPRENTTEGTVTKAVPASIRLADRVMRGPLRNPYRALRQRILARATPVPDVRLSPEFRARLEEELAPDFAVHRAVEPVGA